MLKDFVRHLFPRVLLKQNLKASYTFCLGGMAFTSLLMLAITGILLLFYYQPVPERAYNSILFLESSVNYGSYIRGLHRLSSHLLLLLILLHTLRVILTGAYRHPRHLNWILGVCILFASVFEGYTGYLLPMDQLAYWATKTGMELLDAIPFTSVLRSLLVPDGIGEPLSLLRFYILHISVIPVSIFAMTMLHFYKIRKNRGLLPYL